MDLVGGFIPSEKYELVNWDKITFPTEWENNPVMFQENHQPENIQSSTIIISRFLLATTSLDSLLSKYRQPTWLCLTGIAGMNAWL